MLSLIGRSQALFTEDLASNSKKLSEEVSTSRFLVLGGAGSIGQAVVKEIFKRNPLKLHVVDISENNMVELVRDIRSSFGYIDGDFQTFALDIGSTEYDAFFKADGQYDYVLNLSALKHVRSEKDPYTLMRMVEVNVFNTDKTLQQCIDAGVKKYFCVSTDKAANPVNMMGASKRIMEMFVMRKSQHINVSMARFQGMYLMVTNYIFFSKKTGLLSVASIISGFINLLLLIVFVRILGLQGAAIAFALSMGIRFLLTWLIAHKRHPMPWFNFISKQEIL